ncbi:MAG: hypothetical protein FJ255_01945 [Phycisphaerae bacterium]|nr:hypothetical protein [Phycisphaerae bacterium]
MIARFADLDGDGTVSTQEVVRQIGAEVRDIIRIGNPADPEPTRAELIRYAGALFGDLNADGVVDVGDVAALLQSFAGGGVGTLPEGDLDNDGDIDPDDLFILLDGLGGQVTFTHDEAVLALTGAAVIEFPDTPPAGSPEASAACTQGTIIATLTAGLHLCDEAARCLAALRRNAVAGGCCVRALGPVEILQEILTRTCVRRALVALGIATSITFVNPGNPAIPFDESCDAICSPAFLAHVAVCASELRLNIDDFDTFPEGPDRVRCINDAYNQLRLCLDAAIEAYTNCYGECIRRTQGAGQGPG